MKSSILLFSSLDYCLHLIITANIRKRSEGNTKQRVKISLINQQKCNENKNTNQQIKTSYQCFTPDIEGFRW